MTEEQQLLLLNKYMEGTLSPEEEVMFFTWYAESGAGEFHRLLQQGAAVQVYEAPRPEFLASLEKKLNGNVKRISSWWWAAAAVMLLLAGAGTWLLVNRQSVTPQIARDVPPGRNGAILTLANGEVIELDSLKNGIVATQQGTSISLHNGTLSYDAKNAADISYNMVRTPNARQFHMVLPDGSEVWLNAGSSLKYPTAFIREREVEITGEAFFDVAKNAAMPFKVKINGQAAVDVLGTKFNVNAYTDEKSIDVTLLEGSVRVNNTILRPGQQAQLKEAVTVNNEVNTEQVIAWKTGVFNFDGLGIEAVMRQLSRWYNIEVVYEQGIPSTKFYGEIGRNLDLSQVLEGLKLSGVHFRIENGQRLIVLP